MKLLHIQADEIDIRQLCLDTFKSLRHQPFGIDVSDMELSEFVECLQQIPVERRKDLVFENVQARVRTLLLMNRGFVLGTGDLSEQALGWSTYNGDHMSMYNVNCSIPKTLVKFWLSTPLNTNFRRDPRVFVGNCRTPISPELLPPGAAGEIQQLTEGSLRGLRTA